MGEKLKQFFNRFNAPLLPLQERLFRMVMTAGLFALGIGIISGIISGEDIVNTITLCAAFLVPLCLFTCIKYSLVQLQPVCSFCLL